MSVALAQARAEFSFTSSGTASVSLGSTPTVGNTVIIGIGCNSNGFSSTAPNSPSTNYTTIIQQTPGGTSSGNNVSFFGREVQTGETGTYTFTTTGSTLGFITAWEVSGADSTIASSVPAANIGANNSNSGSVSSLAASSTALSPTAGLSAYSFAIWFWSGGSGSGLSVNQSYVLNAYSGGRGGDASLSIGSTSGTYNPTLSWTTAHPTAGAVIIVQNSTPLSSSNGNFLSFM